MIVRFRAILFYIFLSVLYALNMWGVFPGENHTMIALYISPVILFSTYIRSKDHIYLPYHLLMLMLLFIITIFISTVYAIHVQTAFEYMLYIISVFLIFIYVYNNAKLIKNFIVPFIVISSILSLIYSSLIALRLQHFSSIVPTHDEQLIYRVVDLSHYPQGVFVFFLLITTYVFMIQKKTVSSLLAVLILSILLWFSYLRSAYVGMLVVFMIDFFTGNATIRNLKNYRIPLFIAVITGVFLILPLADNINIPVIYQLRRLVVRDDVAFQYKNFENGRVGLITSALKAIVERPITGYGGGNFYYASLFYTKNSDSVASTSHNLFIDVGAENGIVSFLVFFLLIMVITVNIIFQMRKKNFRNSVIGSFYIGLLTLFQFNFYHLMAFMYVFFFVCAAVLYKEKIDLQDYFIIKSTSFLLALIGVGIIVALYANSHGNSSLALQIYPIYDKAYRYEIADNYRNKRFDEMENIIKQYTSLYGLVPFDMSFLGRFHEYQRDNERALQYYLLALNRAPRDTGYLTRVYDLILLTKQEEEAKQFIQDYLITYPILYPNIYFEDREWFEKWCQENNINCEY